MRRLAGALKDTFVVLHVIATLTVRMRESYEWCEWSSADLAPTLPSLWIE
jgi:hypothetical protein